MPVGRRRGVCEGCRLTKDDVRLCAGDQLLCDACEKLNEQDLVLQRQQHDSNSNDELSPVLSGNIAIDEASPENEHALTSTAAATSVESVTCELICFLQNKINVPVDDLVKIVADFYNTFEIESARDRLSAYVTTRLPKYRGNDKDKNRKTVADMLKLCLDPNIKLPRFRAVNLARLPPVGVDHVDVSALLQEVASLRAEVRAAVNIRTELSEIRGWIQSTQMTTHEAMGSLTPPTNNAVNTEQQTNAVIPSVSLHQQSQKLSQQNAMTSTPTTIESGVSRQTNAAAHSQPVRSMASVVAEAARSGALTATSRARKQPTIGKKRCTMQSGTRLTAVETKKSINIFVSRLTSDSTEKEIVDYTTALVTDHGICSPTDLSVKCTKLLTKFDTYSSFHVIIRLNASRFPEVNKCIMSGDNWPEGVLVRRYFNPKNGDPV